MSDGRLITAFFVVLMVVGLPGNSLVVYVVLRHGPLKTVTNMLLLNLAAADLTFLAVCLPLFIADYVSFGWRFGDVLCMYFTLCVSIKSHAG